MASGRSEQIPAFFRLTRALLTCKWEPPPSAMLTPQGRMTKPAIVTPHTKQKQQQRMRMQTGPLRVGMRRLGNTSA
jgi:hypothetical protein